MGKYLLIALPDELPTGFDYVLREVLVRLHPVRRREGFYRRHHFSAPQIGRFALEDTVAYAVEWAEAAMGKARALMQQPAVLPGCSRCGIQIYLEANMLNLQIFYDCEEFGERYIQGGEELWFLRVPFGYFKVYGDALEQHSSA